MKILILTQKVDINDDVLGFFHGWILEFAKNYEKVTVVCLEKGDYELSGNVKVLSLGKEKTGIKKQESRIKKNKWKFVQLFDCSIVKRLKYVLGFYRYIWQERRNYDIIFVHMNPEYVALGAPLWKLSGKKIGLWYAHGHTPFILKIAEKLSDVIFTSTKSGCRIKSKKIKVVGQGINIQQIKKAKKQENKKNGNIFKIITAGRISPVKDYETLIRAAKIFSKDARDFTIDIIGKAGLPEQEKYFYKLEKMVKEDGLGSCINFAGAVPNKEIPEILAFADLFVNMSHTGSLDKAILEAMAVGIPILTCNEALEEILGEYKEVLMYKKRDYAALAKKISWIYGMGKDEQRKIGMDLSRIVEDKHSIDKLIAKILEEYEKAR